MSTLDWKCRHLRQNPDDIAHPTCAAGVDMSAVRLIKRPCIQNPERPSEVTCPKREPLTAEEKAAEMAPFLEAMRLIGEGLSPCCRAPVERRTTPRSEVVLCSKCRAVCCHSCSPSEEP